MNKKGVAIYLVLTTIFIAFMLAGVIIKIISSQGRLTHHQVSRIQAYYAAQAGMNLAIEKLRIGEWVPPASGSTLIKTLCKSGCDVNDLDIPYTVTITIYPLNDAPDGALISGTAGISVSTNYTYTP